ncbi:MAG: YafY family protein [Actinomycetota bacterium]
MSGPTGRALTLLSLLQTHRHWSGVELAERLGVSERTVRRDVDRLRTLGYPVEATTGIAGGYQLAAGAHLPPLVVDDDEAVALAVGLRAAAGASVDGIEDTTLRVMAKLEQILPDHLRRRIDALNSNLDTLRWTPRTTVPSASLGVLAQGCRDREEVRFDYTGRNGEASNRLVRPHQLVSVGQRWYLVAWDVRRSDWRTFRIDRMEGPRLAGVRFEPLELPADSAAAFVQAGLRLRSVRHEATVVVHGPPDRIEVAKYWFGSQMELESFGGDRHRATLGSDALDWLVSMIAILAVDFDVEVEAVPDPAWAMLADVAARLSSVDPPG